MITVFPVFDIRMWRNARKSIFWRRYSVFRNQSINKLQQAAKRTAVLGKTDGKTSGGAVHFAVQTQTAVLFEGMIWAEIHGTKIKLPHSRDSSKRLINQVFRQGRWHQGCRRGVRSEHILSGSWHASSLHRALLYRSWLSWPVCVRVPTTLLSPPLLISRVGDLDYRRIKNYIPCIDVTIHWQISKNALLKITFAVKGK